MRGGFREAVAILSRTLGSLPAMPPADGTWRRFVEIVLGMPAVRSTTRTAAADLAPPLTTPEQTAAAHTEEIEQAAGKIPRAAARAKLLKALAAWWIKTFGDELAPTWEGSAEHWRESLERLRGVHHELIDRILLFVAGRSAFPLDRAALRIVCRHGWMDAHSEYEEWQSFFTHACGHDPQVLGPLSAALDLVGRQHCGPSPKCEGCPLQSLLPPSGPLELAE
jgi:endonuclease-3 related protein